MTQLSAAAEPLATDLLLTADWVGASQYLRCSTQNQLQFFVDYTPHASSNDETKYLECKLQYTHQPTDTETVGGAFSWRSYTEEQDLGDGASQFFVRVWRIFSNDTDLEDREPTFSRPLVCNAARLAVREVGVSSFGTVSILGAALSLS